MPLHLTLSNHLTLLITLIYYFCHKRIYRFIMEPSPIYKVPDSDSFLDPFLRIIKGNEFFYNNTKQIYT